MTTALYSDGFLLASLHCGIVGPRKSGTDDYDRSSTPVSLFIWPREDGGKKEARIL